MLFFWFIINLLDFNGLWHWEFSNLLHFLIRKGCALNLPEATKSQAGF
jgi:hypothetical protein